MRRSGLGCFTPIGIIAGIITILAIAGAGWAQGGTLFSPGALNAQAGPKLSKVASHAELLGNCAACHSAPWDATRISDRCLTCHTSIKADLANPKALHGIFFTQPIRDNCIKCHTEHHGALASLTRQEIPNFPHDALSFSLKSHQRLNFSTPFRCQDCHGQSFKKIDNPVCADCHAKRDANFMSQHTAAFGDSCLNCHDGKETLGKKFNHQTVSFALTGKHAKVDCTQCHTHQTTLTAVKSTATDCASCHAKTDPHQGKLGADCTACHSSAGWKPAKFDHNSADFKLTGKHIQTACADCHKDKLFVDTPVDCAACHASQDVHQGRLGADCASCHTANGWKPTLFKHNQSAFQLTGKHALAACTDCHKDPLFKGTPVTCNACHQKDDKHQGDLGPKCETCHTTGGWKPTTFDHAKAPFTLVGKHINVVCSSCHTDARFRSTPTECVDCHRKDDSHKGVLGPACASCHTPAAWKPSTFNHNQTGFKLLGKHQQLNCTGCHKNSNFKATPTTCVGCHQQNDVHKGTLGSSCAACHTNSAWKPSTFNHANAAFKLAGKHAQVSCAGCHKDNNFKTTPTNCADCHHKDDVHNGALGSSCATCHSPSAWKPSTFNHANAAFKLVGQHAQVNCTACHKDSNFKAAPTNCVDCHRQNDPHKGSLGSNCAACHSPKGWKPSSFDHNQSAFKLTGAHTSVTCASCHVNQVFKGTPATCIGCHAKDDHHNGQFGTDCASCHSTSSWQNATFDHNKSNFPLTGAHLKVDCKSCHASTFQGTPTACNACHSEPAFHAGSFGINCSSCHNTSTWTPAKFTGTHTFPTNHGGAASCRTCHTSSVTAYTCFTCHNQSETVKHHQERGISDLSNCAACHPNGRSN